MRQPTRLARDGLLAPWIADETILPNRRSRPETRLRSDSPGSKRGVIMLATILNAFYRQACRQYLIAMRRRRWA
jgi:hypothetical protein